MIKLLALMAKHWIFITLFILSVITVLSLWPLEQLPPVPGSDQVHHFLAYGTLMFPVANRKPKYWQAIALGFICWSGVIELIQPYINRYGDFQDLTANTVGLIAGWLTVKVIKLLFSVNSSSE